MAAQQTGKVLASSPGEGAFELKVEAYGVPLAIIADSEELLHGARRALPPGWRPSETSEIENRFRLVERDGAFYNIEVDGDETTEAVNPAILFEVLDVRIRTLIARRSPNFVFVHAGAVAYGGRAILIPGDSFSGKTTLVAELVRAGAAYLSDEYAVLDQEGRVHPYARPLAIRNEQLAQIDHDVSQLGGVAATESVPVGMVVMTQYVGVATWNPKTLTPGEGALALLAHTVPAQDRPEEALRATTRATEFALVLEGDRGEAAELVPQLLERVDA